MFVKNRFEMLIPLKEKNIVFFGHFPSILDIYIFLKKKNETT